MRHMVNLVSEKFEYLPLFGRSNLSGARPKKGSVNLAWRGVIYSMPACSAWQIDSQRESLDSTKIDSWSESLSRDLTEIYSWSNSLDSTDQPAVDQLLLCERKKSVFCPPVFPPPLYILANKITTFHFPAISFFDPWKQQFPVQLGYGSI